MSDEMGLRDGISCVVKRKPQRRRVNGGEVTVYPTEFDDKLQLSDTMRLVHKKRVVKNSG